MASRRISKSVLHNFLGTYTSRYSDYNGYWLFGLLVENIGQVVVDLMHTPDENDISTPMAFAKRIAATKFAEQIEKAGLAMSSFRNAHLEITKSLDARQGVVNGHVCFGYALAFEARAVTDLGKIYNKKISIFVAPHDPKVELRRKEE